MPLTKKIPRTAWCPDDGLMSRERPGSCVNSLEPLSRKISLAMAELEEEISRWQRSLPRESQLVRDLMQDAYAQFDHQGNNGPSRIAVMRNLLCRIADRTRSSSVSAKVDTLDCLLSTYQLRPLSYVKREG